MKNVLLITVILLLAGSMVYAQQGTSSPPTSQQTKQEAQQFLDQGKKNSSNFESTLAELNAGNTSNRDTTRFNQLKSEIQSLETKINTEQGKIKATLDKGAKVNKDALDRVQGLIDQHKAKLAELESFASS